MVNNDSAIHPYSLMQSRVTVSLEPIPGNSGQDAGGMLDGTPANSGARLF